jgi:putative transposon-encoded protein
VARIIELKKEELILKDSEIEGFLERVVTPFGTSAKADVPRKYIGTGCPKTPNCKNIK